MTEELTTIVTQHYPRMEPETAADIAANAAALRIDPELMERILESFDRLVEAVKEVAKWAAAVVRSFYDAVARGCVPSKWIHLSKHAKKARTRKKYRNRILWQISVFLDTD